MTETHTFYGWGNTGNGNVWKVGLPLSKSYSGNFTKTETYTWDKLPSVISNDPLSSASWNGSSGQVSDSGIYVPVLTGKTITRDGKTYSTTYSSFNTYGDAQSISESGDSGGATRSRTLTYLSDPTAISKNIVRGKPASESVTGTFLGTATTTWTYDSNSGNVTNISKDGVSTSYDYNTSGNLSSVTDANSKSKTYLWSNGRISRETNTYYNISRTINANGTIADETDGRGTGYKTTFGYDGLLRLTSITPPAGNATTISYPNSDGSIRRETRGGYVTDYTFDGFGRPSGSSDSKGITSTITYTPYGTKDYEDTNIGDKVSYDYFGRVKEVRHKDNTFITYAYSTTSTNKTTITDEKTKNTELTYKAFGNPDEKYLMSVYDAALKTTTYTRNIQGNLTGITQSSISGNFTRSFAYDPTKKNFLTSETNPETGTITYVRDNVGNMTSKIDSSGTTTYVYDNINRLTSITVTGNPAGNLISFGYDNANNRTSMDYPGGSADYVFDPINRMTQKTETISNRSYTTNFGYDGNDNLQTITYPSGRVVTYGYNTKNEVSSITSSNTAGFSVSNVQHYTTGTYIGLLQSFVLFNGITTNLTYNSRNLTTAITAGSAMNVSYGYTDPRGNTTSYTNTLDTSKNQTYGYDDLNRLNSFSGVWGSGSFGYDDTGNRGSKIVGGQSTTYSYTNNRVGSTSGQELASYNYSTDGLLTGGTWDGISHTLNYDKFENLTSVLAGATTLASFAYDGDGQRVSKTANGTMTVYHYDLVGRTLSEDDGNGNQIADYIYLEGKLVAKVATVPSVSVTKAGTGTGTIISSPSGISCGTTCSAAFSSGTPITLTSAASSGSIFTGWSGGLCAGTGPCSFTLSADMNTTASFALLPTASFSATLPSGAPVSAIFTNNSTNATSWLWNFGDGATSTLQSPTHLYRTPGTYAVSLTATNAAGSVTTTQNLTVSACTTNPVKIGSAYYTTVQAAYNAAATDAVIQVLATDLTESLLATRSVNATIDGGYLCGFATNPEATVLHGAPHLSAGTVKLKNIRIAQ